MSWPSRLKFPAVRVDIGLSYYEYKSEGQSCLHVFPLCLKDNASCLAVKKPPRAPPGTIFDSARGHECDLTDRVTVNAEVYGRDRVAENTPAPNAAAGRVAVAQKDQPGRDNLGHIVRDRLHILEPQLLVCHEWDEHGERDARGDGSEDAPRGCP
jgi:hypothetical protein